jgi:hypothetical protein
MNLDQFSDSGFKDALFQWVPVNFTVHTWLATRSVLRFINCALYNKGCPPLA